MIAIFENVSATSSRKPVTLIKGNLIDVEKLNLFTVNQTEKVFKHSAIKNALPIIQIEMAKNQKLHGGYIAYYDGKSTSYIRIVKKELVAINENHPQCIKIEGEDEWCIMRSHKTC